MSILVNNIPNEKDSTLLDLFIEPKIFLNDITQYNHLLKEDAYVKKIDINYKFRPDRLAYDLWGQDLWYPAILATNNLGSVMHFNPEVLGYNCLIPQDENLIKFLKIIVARRNNVNLSNI